MKFRALAVFAASAALVGLPAHANLVVNGGFETGDFTGWTTQGFDPTLPPALQFSGVESGNSQAGNFSAFFGTPTISRISQTLSTVAGATYAVSFYLMNEADAVGNTVPNSFEFDWDGGPSYAVVNAPAFPYALYQFSLTASSASTPLSFAFSHTPAFWDFDTVDVEQTGTIDVPEPGTLALAGLGSVLGLLVSRRRRGESIAG